MTSQSFKLVQNNVHPNFFLLDNTQGEDDIKIEQSRNLIKFLNNSFSITHPFFS